MTLISQHKSKTEATTQNHVIINVGFDSLIIV